MPKAEKKVEYLELIYDLIFVYIIGRNNSLLLHLEDGFVAGGMILSYLMCGFAVIQIWMFSTYYINLHGKNGVRDHVFIFLNMYLLYYIGEGTRVHWERFMAQYSVAWALILINIGLQFFLEYRSRKTGGDETKTPRGMAFVLFGEALLVLATIPIYFRIGISLAGFAIAFGILCTFRIAGRSEPGIVDFPHLTERAMLFVVFSFGEMIIVIASYFEGGLTVSSIYFSAMCFLIVAGLFLCYEMLYDHIIDRERDGSGSMGYMLIHVFLIFGMSLLTTALEFMQNDAVALRPKLMLLTGAFLLTFFCMFALLSYAKPEMKRCSALLRRTAGISAVFVVLTFLLQNRMKLNILISVLYVGAMLYLLRRFRKNAERAGA